MEEFPATSRCFRVPSVGDFDSLLLVWVTPEREGDFQNAGGSGTDVPFRAEDVES